MNFRKLKQISMALCISLLLTACGIPTTTGGPSMSAQESGISEQPAAGTPSPVAQTELNLPETGIAAATLNTSSPLYTTGYNYIPYETPAETISHNCTQIAFGDSFYILDIYYA